MIFDLTNALTIINVNSRIVTLLSKLFKLRYHKRQRCNCIQSFTMLFFNHIKYNRDIKNLKKNISR